MSTVREGQILFDGRPAVLEFLVVGDVLVPIIIGRPTIEHLLICLDMG